MSDTTTDSTRRLRVSEEPREDHGRLQKHSIRSSIRGFNRRMMRSVDNSRESWVKRASKFAVW